jgi:malonyl CoA-acyl carrier protein transacylase
VTGDRADEQGVAIVGMAGRFPGAPSTDALWAMLMAGTEAVRRFSHDELRAAGVPGHDIADPDYLPYGADLAGIEEFDAGFFGMTPAEARLTDPQHRIFLECVWRALEDAAVPPTAHGGRIGVFGGASLSSYLLHHVLRSAEYRDRAWDYPVLIGNDKDFLATRVSYRLDLRGPSASVQTACSSSLVAVDLACAALRAGRCAVAVAGGVSVFTPQTVGYRRRQGGTLSQDGHCRPFDAAASGMVRGSGCGVVVLKRLADALADGDRIHAVVAATAVNNDGSAKAGYTAPGAAGQAEAVRACLDASGLPASAIGYVEAHGTGTYLGDPIEIEALRRAYEESGNPPRACALGSVKANIGHLDAAAGVTGLIKAALVLRHQTVPPQINLTEPNPELRLPGSPFTIHTEPFQPPEPLRAAAVTSLGIGGTNAHCVLTPAPPPGPRPAPGGRYVLALSAPDGERLRESAGDLLAHLATRPGTRLDDLARTLATGRLPQPHRAAVPAATLDEARTGLRALRDGHPPAAADPRVRAWLGGGDGTAWAGDLRHARPLGLPGVRLRPERHWIDARPDPAPPPTDGAPPPGRSEDDPDDADATVMEVFRTCLGTDRVAPDDDYFHVGGDSLLAVELVDILRRRLGVPLTIAGFTRLRTPRAVAGWCREERAREERPGEGRGGLVKVKDGSAEREVFLVHPSGGGVFFAHALARHTTDPGAVHAIAYPLALAPSLTTIPAMAHHYLGLIRRARPHGPYRLGGYSLGGTVALEIARLLTALGEHVEPVLLFDTPPPAAHPRPFREEEFLDAFPELLALALGVPPPAPDTPRPRTPDEAIEAVRRPGWTHGHIRQLRDMYGAWRACARALATHHPEPYPGPVHLFAAREPFPALHPLVRSETATADGWRRHVTGTLRVTDVPGHHFSMFNGRNLPALARAYDEALRPPPPPPAPGRRPTALLFAGQGVQHPGMGRDLLARHPDLVAEADHVLGYSIAAVCAGDPRRPLTDTAWAQPAVYVVNALAARSHLAETGEPPTVLLGHSLGEYNALEAAGVLTFAGGLRLVAERGAAMAAVTGGGMAAVTGIPEEALRALLATPGFAPLALAAVNTPTSHTVSGTDADLERLTPLLLAHGARAVRRLNVGGPFHSRLMEPAAHALAAVLDGFDPPPPAVPVIANTTALPHVRERIAAELVAQVHRTVLWRRSVERVIADHDPEFHEAGGFRVLTPMLARIRAGMRTP